MNTHLTRRALLGSTALSAVGLALAACGPSGGNSSASGSSGPAVTVITHDSFSVPDDLIAAFQKDTGYTLQITPSGDGGELVGRGLGGQERGQGAGVRHDFYARSPARLGTRGVDGAHEGEGALDLARRRLSG